MYVHICVHIIYIYMYIHTHTYIYIYRERERGRRVQRGGRHDLRQGPRPQLQPSSVNACDLVCKTCD